MGHQGTSFIFKILSFQTRSLLSCNGIRYFCKTAWALELKIKDITFKITEEGKQYAEIEIKGVKTGSRNLPLIDSLPFLKDWIQNGHPSGDNTDSGLFVSLSKNAFGLKLTYDGLANHYQDYYKRVFF